MDKKTDIVQLNTCNEIKTKANSNISVEKGKFASKSKILKATANTQGIDVDSLLGKLVQYANITDALSHVEKTVEYIVQIPLKHEEAFEAKELFLNQNSKTGVLWPTLYKQLDNGKRQFVDNLPIKQEEIFRGNPFEAIASSYHNLYIQNQINDLSELMNRTYHAVERIEKGQMDDRIGYLMAGRDQIIYALNPDYEDRNIAIESGRSNLLIAQGQLFQTLKRKVEGFEAISQSSVHRFANELKHSGYLREKDKEFSDIQEYFSLYLQASEMIAASYVIVNKPEIAKQVFDKAIDDMKKVDFTNLKTIDFVHGKNTERLYHRAVEYIDIEKNICTEDAKDYDLIELQVSGEKLMEVFENVNSKKISETRTE